MRRYPVAPLLEATGLSMSALAQRVGIGGGEYARVRSEGVSELAADRWANRLGLHPAEVWHDFGFAVCAADGCEATFAPRDSRHKFCSTRCSRRRMERERKRRQYQANPERQRARVAAYQADERVAAYRREAERRRYQQRRAA